jgi:glycosyltransferase involved in cell wall biosynthesis
MNILYIVQYWPSLFESYMFREIRWMKERGHKVAVVSLGSGGPLGFRDESSRYADLSGCGVDDMPVLQLGSRHISREQIISEAIAFALQQGSEMIDAHFAREPAEIAFMMNRASGIPFTIRMRGGDVHSNTSPILPEMVESASAICPVSQFLADVLVGNRAPKKVPDGIPVDVCPNKLRVLHYSLPSKCLCGEPVKQSDEIQVVGSIGRLVPIKGFRDVIEAVAGLADEFPGLRLLIVGGGVMMHELLELALEAGISDRVEITGFRSWDEVMSLAGQLHIYVQASELEGFCLAAVEAAFKGMPLVLSRTGIHEECVEPDINGYLFDVGDVAAIRESLKSLLLAGASRRQEMGAASLEIAGRLFCEENVMPKIESIFQATISGYALPS